MGDLILAMNVEETQEQDIFSIISEILVSARKFDNIQDIVLFLPYLDKRKDSVLEYLVSKSYYCPNVNINLLLDEEDYEDMSFTFLGKIKDINPNIFIYSKDDIVKVGDFFFRNFSLNKYSSDELDYFLDSLYSNNINLKNSCLAVSNSSDKHYLNDLFLECKLLEKNDFDVFYKCMNHDKNIDNDVNYSKKKSKK